MASASLAKYIEKLPVISVHDHHGSDAAFKDFGLDQLLINSYVCWGMTDRAASVADRRAFLEQSRHKSYMIWMQRGLEKIYGVSAITLDNWDKLSAKIRRAHAADPNWHWQIRRRFGRVQIGIQDSYWNPGSTEGHPEFFRAAYRINPFVICHHPEMADHNGSSPWKIGGFTGKNFDDYLAFIDQKIAAQKAAGAVALKSALAYDRDIAFKPQTRAAAAAVFMKRKEEVADEARRAYQDFMFDYFCTLAAKYELPFQNHTGTALMGDSGSNPMNLAIMIAKHPQTRFVMFHAGYPWVGEIAGLAHQYTNAYPDLTWLPILNTSAAIRAIRDYLETSHDPNTVCWGADTWTGEECVGAVLAFKHALTVALTQLVAEGYFGVEEAQHAARGFCYENAVRVYRLKMPDA